jgi:MFS family permease
MAAAEEFTPPSAASRQANAGALAADSVDAFVSPTTQAERRRAFVILFVSMTCMGAGQSVMYIVLPSLVRKLGLHEWQGQLPFTVSAAIWVFTSHFWGKRSDHWGRKSVILIGLTAFGISFALFAVFAQLGVAKILLVGLAYPLMVVARAIYGIFGSGAAPAAQAYVADRTTRAERMQGVAAIGAAFGIGTTAGPLFGSWLSAFGLFAPFYATAVVALGSAAAIFLFLPERTRPRVRLDGHRATLQWYDRRILPFVIFATGISTAGAIPVPLMGYLFIDSLHLEPSLANQYTGIGILAMALATLFSQLVLVQRFNISARALIHWGTLIGFASFVMLAVGGPFGALVSALTISGIGFGMVRPSYTAAASLTVNAEEQGAVAGIISATSAAGFIFGPQAATALYPLMHRAPWIWGAVMMAGLYAYALLSPQLRNAGALAPESEVVEEQSGTYLPNA